MPKPDDVGAFRQLTRAVSISDRHTIPQSNLLSKDFMLGAILVRN